MMTEVSKPTLSGLAIASTGVASIAALAAGTGEAVAEGLYGGLSIALHGGSAPLDEWGSDPYLLHGHSFGGFVGYMSDMGGFYGGVELAFTGRIAGDAEDNSDYDDGYDITNLIDLKFRAGQEMGSIFVYGLAGLSMGNSNNYYGESYGFSGINYGIGGEMDVSESMFVGIELIGRTIDGYQNEITSHHGIALRGGFRF